MPQNKNKNRRRYRERQHRRQLQQNSLKQRSKEVLAVLAMAPGIWYMAKNYRTVLEFSQNVSSKISSGLFKIPKTIFSFSSLQIGKKLTAYNQNEMAMRFLSFAIETDSFFDSIKAEAYEKRGQLHLDKGNLDDASQDYQAFSRLNPGYYYSYYVEIQKLEQRLHEISEQESAVTPTNKDNFLTYDTLQELEAAIKSLRPDDYKHYKVKSEKRTAKQHQTALYEAAIRDLTVVLAINEYNFWDREKRSELYEKTGKYLECIADLKELIRLLPSQNLLPEQKNKLYQTFYGKKIALEIKTSNIRAAIDSYNHLIGLFPDNVANYREQAALFLKTNNIKKAVNCYKKIADINFQSLVPPDFFSPPWTNKERSIENRYIPIENDEVAAPLYADLSGISLTHRQGNHALSLKFFDKAMVLFSKLGRLDEIKNYLPPLVVPSTIPLNRRWDFYNNYNYAQDFYKLVLNFLMEKGAYGEIFSVLDKTFSNPHILQGDEYYEESNHILSFKGIKTLLDNLQAKQSRLSQVTLDKISEFQLKNMKAQFQHEKIQLRGRIGGYIHKRHAPKNPYDYSSNPEENKRHRLKRIERYRDQFEQHVKAIIPLAEAAKCYEDVVDYCNFIFDYEDDPHQIAKYTLAKLGALIKMEQYSEVIKIGSDFIEKFKGSVHANDKSLLKSPLAKIYHLRGLAKENLPKEAGKAPESPWVDYSEARRLAPEIRWLDKAVYYLGDIARQRIENLPHYYGELVNGRFTLYQGVAELSGSSAFFKSGKYLDSGALNSGNPLMLATNSTQDFCPAPAIIPG